jgi:hypothetical protein
MMEEKNKLTYKIYLKSRKIGIQNCPIIKDFGLMKGMLILVYRVVSFGHQGFDFLPKPNI